MTLKEKLSLSRIQHFSLVLEQQHNSSKLLLLHDEERIHQVSTYAFKLSSASGSSMVDVFYMSMSLGRPEEGSS